MDAKTVEIKLQAGELVALLSDSLNVHSSAYSIFLLVCDKEDTYTGFVSCTCCKKIIKHDLKNELLIIHDLALLLSASAHCSQCHCFALMASINTSQHMPKRGQPGSLLVTCRHGPESESE